MCKLIQEDTWGKGWKELEINREVDKSYHPPVTSLDGVSGDHHSGPELSE